jgi:hypothetical protein
VDRRAAIDLELFGRGGLRVLEIEPGVAMCWALAGVREWNASDCC